MSHQFKPGDKALIVGAKTLTENIGKTCELVQFLQPGDKYTTPDGAEAIHVASLPPAWLVVGEICGVMRFGGQGDLRRISGWGVALPEFLMPLRGDFEPVREMNREVTA